MHIHVEAESISSHWLQRAPALALGEMEAPDIEEVSSQDIPPMEDCSSPGADSPMWTIWAAKAGSPEARGCLCWCTI